MRIRFKKDELLTPKAMGCFRLVYHGGGWIPPTPLRSQALLHLGRWNFTCTYHLTYIFRICQERFNFTAWMAWIWPWFFGLNFALKSVLTLKDNIAFLRFYFNLPIVNPDFFSNEDLVPTLPPPLLLISGKFCKLTKIESSEVPS